MQNDKRWQHADSSKTIEHMAAPQQDELPDLEEISEETLSQVSGGGGFGPFGGASGLGGVTLAGTLAAKAAASNSVVGKVVSVAYGPVIGTGLKAMGKVIPDSVVQSQVSRMVKGV
jgi:hypothetical protein